MVCRYAICIDFEATCWENRIERPQEIIEFGAVFVDLVFQDLKHEFQKYLRPVEDPELSQYCKNLTKIKQSDVDNGVLLKDALDDFHDWLKFIEVQENVSLKFGDSERNVVLVTWSNNDLNYYLKNECERKGITRKSYFFDWVDAQELYEVWQRLDYIPRFDKALRREHIPVVGTAHSAISDAKNLATLLLKMFLNRVQIQ